MVPGVLCNLWGGRHVPGAAVPLSSLPLQVPLSSVLLAGLLLLLPWTAAVAQTDSIATSRAEYREAGRL
jgi:hypothetical protein